MKSWIRSQHLICVGTDLSLKRLIKLNSISLSVHSSNWWTNKNSQSNWQLADGTKTITFKILRATAAVPRPGGESLVTYWAKRGSNTTRYSEINS